MDAVGSPSIPGDCKAAGVTTVGVSVTEVAPGVVDDMLEENTGTGGRVDKLNRGTGVLNILCTVWVCAA